MPKLPEAASVAEGLSLEELRARYNGNRSHLTRNLTIVSNALKGAPRHGAVPQALAHNLLAALAKVQKFYDTCCSLSVEISTLDPAREEVMTVNLDDAGTSLATLSTQVYEISGRVPQEQQQYGQQQQQQEGGPRRLAKPMDSLKPFELSLEHSPAKYKLWRDQWFAYYSASQLAAYTVQEQQAFLFRCLDVDLLGLIRPEITETTVILPGNPGDVCCLSILEAKFYVRYPLLQRRHEWLNARRTTHEGIGAWYSKFKAKACEADLDGITREDLMVLGIIMNLNDATVADRIVRLDEPTLRNVERVLTASQVSTNAASVQGAGPVAVAAAAQAAPAQPCDRCGGNHKASDCVHKNTTCDYCKKVGHLKAVCRSRKRDQKKKPKQGAVQEVQTQAGATANPEMVVNEAAVAPIGPIGGAASLAGSASVGGDPSVGYPTLVQLKIMSVDGNSSILCHALPDTGAGISVVPWHLVARQLSSNLMPSRIRLRTANGRPLDVSGYINVFLRVPRCKPVQAQILVSKDVTKCLISLTDQKKMGMLHPSYPLPFYSTVATVLPAATPPSSEAGPPPLPPPPAASPAEAGAAALRDALIGEFSDVFSDELKAGTIAGEPMRIKLSSQSDIV